MFHNRMKSIDIDCVALNIGYFAAILLFN